MPHFSLSGPLVQVEPSVLAQGSPHLVSGASFCPRLTRHTLKKKDGVHFCPGMGRWVLATFPPCPIQIFLLLVRAKQSKIQPGYHELSWLFTLVVSPSGRGLGFGQRPVYQRPCPGEKHTVNTSLHMHREGGFGSLRPQEGRG